MLAHKRIPVTSGGTVIEHAGPERVRVLLAARNAVVLVRTRKGAIGAIALIDCGADWRYKPAWNNPQKHVLKSETEENPRNVWTFKRKGERCSRAV